MDIVFMLDYFPIFASGTVGGLTVGGMVWLLGLGISACINIISKYS